MGALMEKAGCECALPEYCFTRYLEPGFRDGDIPVEICEAVVEARKETGGLRFQTLPEIQAACVFHKGSYRSFAQSYETVLSILRKTGMRLPVKSGKAILTEYGTGTTKASGCRKFRCPSGKKLNRPFHKQHHPPGDMKGPEPERKRFGPRCMFQKRALRGR